MRSDVGSDREQSRPKPKGEPPPLSKEYYPPRAKDLAALAVWKAARRAGEKPPFVISPCSVRYRFGGGVGNGKREPAWVWVSLPYRSHETYNVGGGWIVKRR